MNKSKTANLTNNLTNQIKQWGMELGFEQVGISDIQLADAETHLNDWLKHDFHGEMDYMAKHGQKRTRPNLLIPGTKSIISVRLNYLPQSQSSIDQQLSKPLEGFISRYALGRDYHKVLRNRLKSLAKKIESQIGSFNYRVFTDSAPIMEKAIAEKAGLGWIGKHSNLINRKQGSWFFLGEMYTDLPLAYDEAAKNHCGSCSACLDICPTRAIVAPYQVDARLCISYLTIELHGSIPVHLRSALGNRIYGCDDCQLICPWNRFAKLATEPDFSPRHNLDRSLLSELFLWSEPTFMSKMEGSAIRRIGHDRWLRNIAIALGNTANIECLQVLQKRLSHPSEMVREHVRWAIDKITQSN